MIGPRFVVWRLFNPKWHIMNLFDDGNFGETKSFVKDKGGVIHAAAELACLRTKRKSPVLGMFCGFIGLRTSGNIIEVVSSMNQITDCLYKITTKKR